MKTDKGKKQNEKHFVLLVSCVTKVIQHGHVLKSGHDQIQFKESVQ